MPDQCLSDTLLAKLNTHTPAELGPKRRQNAKSQAEVEATVRAALHASDRSHTDQSLILSLALLWHDHLDASHDISQSIKNASGSFIHGIMHRREPDYPNAKYWFRTTGNHPVFTTIASRVHNTPDIASSIVRSLASENNQWDPFAFVDACEKETDSHSANLRLIQQIEYECLLVWLCEA